MGEMVLNGVASDVYRGSVTLGTQADAAWRATAHHTLRAGAARPAARPAGSAAQTTLLPLDPPAMPVDDPLTLGDRSGRTGWLYGAYVQDEWRLTEPVTLDLGLRATRWRKRDRRQLSPRVNLVWRPDRGHDPARRLCPQLHPAAIRTACQNATMTNFQGTTGESPGSLLNDPVRPERAHRFDAGLSQRLGQTVTLVSSLLQGVRPARFGQFGEARSPPPSTTAGGYGVEFCGNWRSERWHVYANLAVSRSAARDISSAQYTFDPEELTSIAGKYRPHRPRPAVDRVGRRGAERLGGRSAAASTLYGNGLRRGFANSRAGAMRLQSGDAQMRRPQDRRHLNRPARSDQPFDTSYQLPTAAESASARRNTGCGAASSRA